MPGEWWRNAVIYQVYPRSFADANGDGIGDLPGITSRLDYLHDLGVDAVWLSPFMRSPQKDHGYDVSDFRDVDPIFGSLADFDAMVSRAHDLGLKVIVDIVPNHSSSEHPAFQEALAAAPGSPERDRYIFRDGRGEHGELPPNNWEHGVLPAPWTRVTEADGQPGQWYLHIFDSSQPDFNWDNPWVHEEFESILRFWLDRGVDGFRIDVAHGLVKEAGLPDFNTPWDGPIIPSIDVSRRPPWIDQDGVHPIYQRWRAIVDEYQPARILVAEAWLETERLIRYVRPDEMHQAFNFRFALAQWSAASMRTVITESLAGDALVGAPTTWVLSNHDIIRHATRLGYPRGTRLPNGLGPEDPQPDAELGLRRARAMSLVMLGLPGSAYLYYGEELGLPEAIDLPDEDREDYIWVSSGGAVRGRDGCRVPMPWAGSAPSFGFGPGPNSWLTQPAEYGALAVEQQTGDSASTLEFYRLALATRRSHALGDGQLTWLEDLPAEILGFRNGDIVVVANPTDEAIRLPLTLQPVVASTVGVAANPGALTLPANSAVWLRNEQL
jgi:alpha-glucosidase